MRTHTLNDELLAPVSMQEAFALFENPYNLAKITPQWLGFKILDSEVKMREGLEIGYLFRPVERGTIVSDQVDYALPLGPVGALAHRWIAGRQLREIFDYRQKAIMDLLVTGAATAPK